jgi:small ligand-binding sensory domain FIST
VTDPPAFAASASEHPDPRQATGEVVGDVLEKLSARPDLVLLFVTASHAAAMADIADAVRRMLEPGTLLGCAAVSVVSGARELEERPAVSLWAGNVGPCRPVRLDHFPGAGDWQASGMAVVPADEPTTMVALPDPFSFPADRFLADIATTHPQLSVIGGLASAARGPGENRLVLDDRVYDDGAVAVLLPSEASSTTVVSQGCRPIGEPFTVTRSERNLLLELGSRPAVERLTETLAALEPDDRSRAQLGLQVGIVIDEQRDDFAQGDFLIRNVLGADPERGAIAVGDVVEMGSVVQFQVRDAESADADLRARLSGHEAEAALLFTCNGRGAHLFGTADHDARLVHRGTGSRATTGMFCAGELGPVGGRNFLHGFTASALLFHGAAAHR